MELDRKLSVNKCGVYCTVLFETPESCKMSDYLMLHSSSYLWDKHPARAQFTSFAKAELWLSAEECDDGLMRNHVCHGVIWMGWKRGEKGCDFVLPEAFPLFSANWTKQKVCCSFCTVFFFFIYIAWILVHSELSSKITLEECYWPNHHLLCSLGEQSEDSCCIVWNRDAHMTTFEVVK